MMNTTVNAFDFTPMSEEESQADRIADRLMALCDRTRLRILRALADLKDAIVQHDTLVKLVGVTQSRISQHISVLLRAGFLHAVTRHGRGIPCQYFVDRVAIRQALSDMLHYIGMAGV